MVWDGSFTDNYHNTTDVLLYKKPWTISPMNFIFISVRVIFPSPVTDMMLAGFNFSCITAKEVVYIIVSASLFYSISESVLGSIGIISIPSGRPRELSILCKKIKGRLLWETKMCSIYWVNFWWCYHSSSYLCIQVCRQENIELACSFLFVIFMFMNRR